MSVYNSEKNITPSMLYFITKTHKTLVLFYDTILKNSTQLIDKMTYTSGTVTSKFGQKGLGWFDSWAERLDTYKTDAANYATAGHKSQNWRFSLKITGYQNGHSLKRCNTNAKFLCQVFLVLLETSSFKIKCMTGNILGLNFYFCFIFKMHVSRIKRDVK